VSLNTTPRVPVERGVMVRTGLIVSLALLALAAPAWAGGERVAGAPSVVMPLGSFAPRSTTTVLPASSPFAVTTRPFAASSAVGAAPPLPFVTTPVPESRHHRPATIFFTAPTTQVIVVQQPVYYQTAAAPGQCVTPGYWSYAWVPYTTTQNVWVQGSWTADGAWIDSHWELRPYSSGYYEPLWTPAQSYAC
jgi:hypothetical protein